MSSLLYAGDFENLDVMTDEVMEYYPNQAGPLYYKAQVFFAKSNFEESLEWLDESDMVGGRSGAYVESNAQLRALNYSELGDINRGLQILLLLEEESEDIRPSTMELIGDLYFKHDNKEAAGEYWKRAIDLGGNMERIDLKLQSL